MLGLELFDTYLPGFKLQAILIACVLYNLKVIDRVSVKKHKERTIILKSDYLSHIG